MSKFTKQEIEAEHRRRRGPAATGRNQPLGYGDVCIHCGHPLSRPLPPGQEAGFCDSCESQDS